MCFIDHKFVIILQIILCVFFRYDAYTIPMTPATVLDITTNTNEAYNLVTRGGGGGGRQQEIEPPSQQVGGSHEDAYEEPFPPPLQPSQCQRGARAAAGAASGGGGEGEGGRGTGEEEVVYELIPGEK